MDNYILADKKTLMKGKLSVGMLIKAIPHEFNHRGKIIDGTFISINNNEQLYSKLVIKLSIKDDNGKTKYIKFQPIRYIIYYKDNDDDDDKRIFFINLLEKLEQII